MPKLACQIDRVLKEIDVGRRIALSEECMLDSRTASLNQPLKEPEAIRCTRKAFFGDAVPRTC
jgi:hypothetical protein